MGAVVLDTVRVDLSVQLLKEGLKVIGTNYKLVTAFQINVSFVYPLEFMCSVLSTIM